MKKITVFTVCAILAVVLFTRPTFAETDIKSIIPSDVLNQLQLEEIDTTDPSTALNAFSFKNIMQLLQSSIKRYLPQFTSFLANILIIVFLFAILEQVSLGKIESSYRFVLTCVGNAILVLLLYRQFASTCALIEENLETIRVFCDASIPVLSGLLITGGKNFAATLFSYGISLSSALISGISAGICLPLIRIYLAIGCCGTVWEDIHFHAMTDMIKKFIKWLIGIVFSVFTLTLSLQGILSKSADNMAQKVLKTAAGSIPFMGSVLSQGLDGAFTLASGTKTATSVIGIAVIVAVFIGPALLIGLQTLALYIATTFSEMFASKGNLSVLKTVHGAYELMLGLFLISVLMSIICFLVICIGAS